MIVIVTLYKNTKKNKNKNCKSREKQHSVEEENFLLTIIVHRRKKNIRCEKNFLRVDEKSFVFFLIFLHYFR